MAHVDYFFSPISPFTYLTGTRLEDMAKTHGATITYKPLDIMGLFGRTGGVPPKDRHPNRQEYRLQELRRRAALAEMAINIKPMFWPTNAAPASYAIIAAQADGSGDVGKLVNRLTACCWAEEKDISQDDVIRACLTDAGFNADLADKGMMASADTFAANLEEAVNRGAFGAPFYITDADERFWGQDRLDDLEAHLAGKI